MSEISNIDDVLITQQPAVKNQKQPESKPQDPEKELAQEVPLQPLTQSSSAEPNKVVDSSTDEYGNEQTENTGQLDDYGNEVQTPKTYTEDEVNERINSAIRERFARMERNNQQTPNQQQAQQQTKDGFEYDSTNPDSWQQQLEGFVEQVVMRIPQKQADIAHRQYEEQASAQHQAKFREGASRFKDFHDVVGHQPFTDAMTLATRGIQDPSAFVYAASKRAPDELKKISEMRDPYAQMVAIGKLEERMKQQKPTTKTPKPMEQTKGDMVVPHKSDKYPTIEEQIAQDAARRLELQRQRRR